MLDLIELRSSGSKKTLRGYVVPWGETIRIAGTDEVFRRGAFDDWFARYPPAQTSKRVALNIQHNMTRPIGVMTRTENRAAGQWAEFRLAGTDAAAEAAQLVSDGVLAGFSLEFRSDDGLSRSGTHEIRDAEMLGVGLVACPAYDGAVLTRAANAQTLDHWRGIITTAQQRLDQLKKGATT